MGQAQINVRTRACSRTSIARTKQAALTHNVRGKELILAVVICPVRCLDYPAEGYGIKYEGSFLEKSQSGCVQNFCHFVCLHHFWA